MRTHVSKMLIGVGIDVGAPAAGEVLVAPWAEILSAAGGGAAAAAAASDEFGFIKAIDDGAGGLDYITAGPFSTANSIIDSNPYSAPVQQVVTMTLDVTNLVDQKAYIIKVAYHDNLSIVPNQIKFTTITAVFKSGMTTTSFADEIRSQFNKQDFKFFTVSGAATVVFTGIVLKTASNYNNIDRPEMIVFEVGVPDAPTGAFTVATTPPAALGQGSESQIAWLEEQHMGRRGYSDRRMWNNTLKYKSQLPVTGVTDFATLVITDNLILEGDLEDTRSNPIGAVIAVSDAAAASIITALGTIGNTVNVIEHPVDA